MDRNVHLEGKLFRCLSPRKTAELRTLRIHQQNRRKPFYVIGFALIRISDRVQGDTDETFRKSYDLRILKSGFLHLLRTGAVGKGEEEQERFGVTDRRFHRHVIIRLKKDRIGFFHPFSFGTHRYRLFHDRDSVGGMTADEIQRLYQRDRTQQNNQQKLIHIFFISGIAIFAQSSGSFFIVHVVYFNISMRTVNLKCIRTFHVSIAQIFSKLELKKRPSSHFFLKQPYSS